SCKMELRWISGHSEVEGNEKADELAKEAAQGKSSPLEELPLLLRKTLPVSASAEKQAYVSEIKTMWAQQWELSPRCTRMEQLDKEFPFTKFHKIQNSYTRA
ncbi:hypothetical protein BDZ97DRAFT_1638098, partial [Flammula alnicola]